MHAPTTPNPSSAARTPESALNARAGFFAFLLALAPFLACALRFAFVCDDAFISYRYSRHLVEGAGLVFNRGEDPPVEGFSNLAWVLWIAPWIRAGLDPVWVANGTSIACGGVLLGLVTRWTSRRLGLGFRASAAAGLFLATLPTFSLWATSGLETLPFALCVFGVFERLTLARGRPSAAGACAWAVLASLLRVDGAAWAIASALAAGAALAPEERRAWGRALFVLGGVLLGVLAALTAWRLATFGDWIPNTARVKAELSSMRLERGAKYALTWLGTLPGAPLALVLGFLGTRAVAGSAPCAPCTRRRAVLAAGAFTTVALAASVWVGGDFMPFGRFLVPATPFLALALAAGIGRAPSRARLAAAGLVVGLSVASTAGASFLPDAAREALHFRWNEPRSKSEIDQWRGMKERAETWRLLGRALRHCTRPNESIVLGNIGAVGYETELRILDPFGLVDREVARRPGFVRASPGHDKGVPLAYFLPRRPDYLGAYVWPASEPVPPLPPELDLLVRAGRAYVVDERLDPSNGFPCWMVLRLVRARA